MITGALLLGILLMAGIYGGIIVYRYQQGNIAIQKIEAAGCDVDKSDYWTGIDPLDAMLKKCGFSFVRRVDFSLRSA